MKQLLSKLVLLMRMRGEDLSIEAIRTPRHKTKGSRWLIVRLCVRIDEGDPYLP